MDSTNTLLLSDDRHPAANTNFEAEKARLQRRIASDIGIFHSAASQLATVLASHSAYDLERPVSKHPVTPFASLFGTGTRTAKTSDSRRDTDRKQAQNKNSGTRQLDPLFEVCRLVAQRLGTQLSPAPDACQCASLFDRLQQVCESSRLHHRKVRLRGDWWKQDNGPVIGFLSKAQDGGAGITEYLAHPVALLPSSASYRMVDPTTGSVRAVNAEVAKELHEYAFMLYSTALNEVHVPQGLVAYLFRRHWRELGAIVAIAIAGGLVTMLIPIVTGIIYGRIIPNGYRSELSQLVAVLFAAALGACTFQVIRATSVLRLKIKLDLHLQPLVWGRLLALPVSFFRRFSVGDLADRIQGMGAIRQLLLADVTTTALALVTSVTSFGLLFYYSWRLGLLASGLLLSFTVVTFVLTLLQLRHRRVALELQGKLSTLAFAFVDGIAKLRSSGAEIRSYARWAGQYAEHARSGLRAQSIANLQAGLTTFYLLASELLLFAFVGFRLSSRLSVGSFLAFSAAFGQIQAALLTFSSVIPELVAILPLYRRLEPVLTESPEVADAKEEIELSGDVEVRNVSFRYQERGPSVLDRISLKVGKGEFVAIVGPSGSGKSTLIRLLLGFETPTSGSIAYDDRELASLDLKSVRRQIGTVLQNSKPIPGDILSNIIGGTNRDIGDAWNAARMAGIDQEIKAMPMGMQTLIGEGAKMFSGGERQRLMIARAVVNKPRIVLLDEATSALDNPAQEKIQLCLEQMKITRIVVAHRLSTVRRADRIYVFENGRIIDEGTYEDLSQKDGYFTKMMSRQVVG